MPCILTPGSPPRRPLRCSPASFSARGLLPGGASSARSDGPAGPFSPLAALASRAAILPRQPATAHRPSPSHRRPPTSLAASCLPRGGGLSSSSWRLSALAPGRQRPPSRRGGGRVQRGSGRGRPGGDATRARLIWVPSVLGRR